MHINSITLHQSLTGACAAAPLIAILTMVACGCPLRVFCTRSAGRTSTTTATWNRIQIYQVTLAISESLIDFQMAPENIQVNLDRYVVGANVNLLRDFVICHWPFWLMPASWQSLIESQRNFRETHFVVVCLYCSVQNFKTIWQLIWMLWKKETLPVVSLTP